MNRVAKFLSPFHLNRISGKLLLTVGTLLIPTLLLGYLLYSSVNSQIVFARNERIGVEYFGAIRQAIGHAIEYRRLTAEFVSGQTEGKTVIERKQAELAAAVKVMEEMEKKLTAETPGQTYTPKVWVRIQTEWKQVTEAVTAIKPKNREKAIEVLTACDNFTLALRDLMTEAANTSKLTLDPEYTSYALQSIVLNQTADADLTGQIAWRAIVATALPSADDEGSADKIIINRLYGELKAANDLTSSGMSIITEERREAEGIALGTKLTQWKKSHDDLLDYVDAELLKPAKSTATARKLTVLSNNVVDADFGIVDTAQPLLDKELVTRITGFRTNLLIGFSAVGGGLVLAMGLGYLVTRGFSRQIRAYLDLFRAVDLGHFEARAEKVTSDELGQMAGSFNQVLATTEKLIRKQKAEYDSLQASIMKLLEEVSSTADGDLTMQAEVSSDATGAIADSFNYTIEQLRKIISRVQSTTIEVANAANEMDAATKHLANGSENQAEQIISVSAAIDDMASTIQQVSDNAALSATVALQALQNARQGNSAVRDTIDGMTRIREQTQETAKRLKRLGETSQEIGQIVQLIDDIADRTGILALNASIQAAAAGDAGRGFAVVAEEVERLAVRSADATKKIAVLVRAIQGETTESVAAMERNIQEVVGGSKIAHQAGVSLAEIEGVSVKLAELIQSISVASKQQAKGSEELAKSMVGISEITQQTAVGTKRTAESVNDLTRLANDLRGSVSAFKLPAEMMPESLSQIFGKAKTKANTNKGAAAQRKLQPSGIF